MAARSADPSQAVLARQKAAAERLRREVLGADGSLKHPYFRDLRRQQKTFDRATAIDELFEVCSRADVVYVGDFHASADYQHFAARLLEEVAARVPRVALGVEFIYTRQQRQLDRRQARLISDATFLRRIHYREEWGYPWEGFRALLDRARALGVRVHALDVPPRGGFDGLARRDEHAARRIVSILESEPDTRLVVLYGESHLSANHIPRRVRTQLGRRGSNRRTVAVFQDPDRLYWTLVAAGRPLPPAVKLSDEAYAVFHGSPLTKYEAYRQVLERWRGDVPADEEIDLTPAVHHLIGVLLRWFRIRPDRYRLHHQAGWSEDLADAFPEVYSGPDATHLLAAILEEHRRTPDELDEAETLLSQRGALYDSRSNALFLTRYLPGRAAMEGARFLRAALAGRLFDPPEEEWADPVARAYGSAYNEGLAVLGSRLVDPTADFPGIATAGSMAVTGGAAAEAPGPDAEHAEWLAMHRRFETRRGARPPRPLLDQLRRSRPLRRALARDLGYRMGEALFENVRRGELDSRALRHLFKRPLSADRAQRVVIRLLSRDSRPEDSPEA